ncbi:MAG: MCE family protein [Fibrobacteres bacterium]|nr:MCE family protein [Fibrobacterota bacterium]
MARRIHVVYKEYFVGAFLILATLTLIALILATLAKNEFLEKKYFLKTVYPTRSGMAVGAKVKIAGMTIGQISDLYFTPEYKIEFVLEIQKRYQPLIRSNSVAALTQEGFISDKIVDISIGDQKLDMLEDNMYINPKPEVLNIDSLMVKAVKTVDNVAEIIDRINRGDGTVGKILVKEDLYNDIRGISGAAVTSTGHVNNLLTQLNTTADQVNGMLRDLKPVLKNGSDASAQLPGILERVKGLLDSAALLAGDVHGVTGNLPAVMGQSQDLMGNVDDIMGAVKKTWPISSKLEPAPNDPPLFIEK